MYQIKYSYNTGDSFHNENDLEGTLPFKWKNLDRAKESLARIRDHYEWYSKLNSYMAPPRDELIKAASKQPWYVKEYEFCLNLVDDNGKDFQTSVSTWCGYFEGLNWAEITSEPIEGMRVEF